VIASIAFRNFKALRSTRVQFTPFNLVIGPNGSGKTSLIEALMRLRTLSQLAPSERPAGRQRPGGPEIEVAFCAPYERLRVRLGCVSGVGCDTLGLEPADAPEWAQLREELGRIRSYSLDHDAIARPAVANGRTELSSSGGNLAAVLQAMRATAPAAYAALCGELLRVLPEFRALELIEGAGGRVEFALRLAENGMVPANELSQGMRYFIAVLALAFDPDPPRILCIEEVDRGIHPRTLREVRDALYRLSYPAACGSTQRPVQIVTTSHSPYFIDLFRDHPEEIIISDKHGREARFARLADRTDLPELLREGSLGDMWFSGILGGVPEER